MRTRSNHIPTPGCAVVQIGRNIDTNPEHRGTWGYSCAKGFATGRNPVVVLGTQIRDYCVVELGRDKVMSLTESHCHIQKCHSTSHGL